MGSERRCYGFVAIVNWCIRKSWKLGDILTHLGSIRDDGGLYRWCNDKETTCQCRRGGFNPWVRKIP